MGNSYKLGSAKGALIRHLHWVLCSHHQPTVLVLPILTPPKALSYQKDLLSIAWGEGLSEIWQTHWPVSE